MSENQEQHKTWTMLRRAIPPIVPTAPNHTSGITYAYEFDAQWNTGNGHNSKLTEWQYIPGKGSENKRNLVITNGVWVDKNCLQFDGTGYMVPTTQNQFSPSNGSELFVVDGIGTLYSKVRGGYVRSLTITENSVIHRFPNGGTYTTTVNVPGADVRMIYCQYKQLVVYDKYGNRYRALRSEGQDNYVYSNSVKYCEGFVGKIYSIKEFLPYYDNFTVLDKEWEYAKNRFRL